MNAKARAERAVVRAAMSEYRNVREHCRSELATALRGERGVFTLTLAILYRACARLAALRKGKR